MLLHTKANLLCLVLNNIVNSDENKWKSFNTFFSFIFLKSVYTEIGFNAIAVLTSKLLFYAQLYFTKGNKFVYKVQVRDKPLK